MKRLIISTILLSGSLISTYPCSTHGIHTQAQVNALICPYVEIDLIVEPESSMTGDPIFHVNSFSSIAYVGGNLIIQDNPYLTNIQGLSNLTSVGGCLIIQNNPMLQSCCALDRLINEGIVQGEIIIQNNGGGDCTSNGSQISSCLVIPTLGQWGMVILVFFLLIVGMITLKWSGSFHPPHNPNSTIPSTQ